METRSSRPEIRAAESCAAVDPVRAAEISFTAHYIEIEGTYLVPAGAPLQ